MTRRLIDLSMEVYKGMMTYPNVAKPVIVEMETYSQMAQSVGTDKFGVTEITNHCMIVTGDHIGTLCAAIHRRDGAPGVRRILGVLALAKKYGAAVVENGCAVALELGVADYRFVRRYLERHAPVPLTLRQVDPLIRELTHYRDVIARNTEEATP